MTVRLTPKSARDRIDSPAVLADGRRVVPVRVRAAPEKGAANTAMIKLLATRLRIAKSNIRLIAGATSRLKTVEIAGDGPALTRSLSIVVQKAAKHDR